MEIPQMNYDAKTIVVLFIFLNLTHKNLEINI